MIGVHYFSRAPEAQPFNLVPCCIHPHQADTHSGVKRRAEESNYYKSREHHTEHVRSIAAFPNAEEERIPRRPNQTQDYRNHTCYQRTLMDVAPDEIYRCTSEEDGKDRLCGG